MTICNNGYYYEINKDIIGIGDTEYHEIIKSGGFRLGNSGTYRDNDFEFKYQKLDFTKEQSRDSKCYNSVVVREKSAAYSVQQCNANYVGKVRITSQTFDPDTNLATVTLTNTGLTKNQFKRVKIETEYDGSSAGTIDYDYDHNQIIIRNIKPKGTATFYARIYLSNITASDFKPSISDSVSVCKASNGMMWLDYDLVKISTIVTKEKVSSFQNSQTAINVRKYAASKNISDLEMQKIFPEAYGLNQEMTYSDYKQMESEVKKRLEEF